MSCLGPTRRWTLLAAAALAGCGLSQRPYAERRAWPLLVRRPETLPPRLGGPVLLVRTLRAGPGLEARGLQSIRPDGSIRTEFYEEWAVPPAEAVEDALRNWLAACGRFAAVLAPGSRLPADQVLEGELDALWSEPARHDAYAAIGVTVVEQNGAPKVRTQQSLSARAPLDGADPPAAVAAMRAALAEVFSQIEAVMG
jgi:ABC-type uncharacterized transport system auxiliary subunit